MIRSDIFGGKQNPVKTSDRVTISMISGDRRFAELPRRRPGGRPVDVVDLGGGGGGGWGCGSVDDGGGRARRLQSAQSDGPVPRLRPEPLRLLLVPASRRK